ncbi:MAG: Oxidoreductase, short-chain dehydrogenase/reductase family [Candidatus Kapaibacterium sp.]|nr:MAG: Oxidoreductase, short-chain dehydrogenase/reductase family [Candidatus Kapabacteria bacterium]
MKKILVLGGYSAISQAVLELLAKEEVILYLVGRDIQKLEIVRDHLNSIGRSQVYIEAMDLNKIEEHRALLERATKQMNGLDLLFVCYGVLPNQKKLEQEPEKALDNYFTNAFSTINFVSLVANYFESKGKGTIAVVTSVAGERGRKSNYFYGSAKSCVDTFLEGLRHRLFSKGIKVVTIKPGIVDTPMTANLERKTLMAKPERVAQDIVKAFEGRKSVVYTPWIWRYIMLIVKLLPGGIFYRTDF